MSLITCPSLVLEIIAKYATYVYAMSLKFTCRKINQDLKLNFIEVFKERIGKHVPDPTEFCDMMYKHQVYISGSSIMAFLYDTNDYNDIDIYEWETTPKINCKEVASISSATTETHASTTNSLKNTKNGNGIMEGHICYCRSEYHFCIGEARLEFLQYLYRKCNFSPELRAGNSGTNALNSYFRVNNSTTNKFQHIATKHNPNKFIYVTYDLDICKNVFNGQSLTVKSWDKLIRKRDVITPTYLLNMGIQYMRTVDYYHNYTKTSLEEYMKSDYKIDRATYISRSIIKFEERKLKYEKRGFKIIQHPEWLDICKKVFDILILDEEDESLPSTARILQHLDDPRILEILVNNRDI